jgi:tRNA-Thr(GGU) m(6)t(6)A37 methyltransferase TsaA
MKPIGVVHTDTIDKAIPRHWSVSDIRGRIELDPEYTAGLEDMVPGQEIVVLFAFHQSPPFSSKRLKQTPPHKSGPKGVFSICSPVRPNPIGLSVVRVLAVSGTVIEVEGIDMLDGTPVLDIKPHIDRRGGRQRG